MAEPSQIDSAERSTMPESPPPGTLERPRVSASKALLHIAIGTVIFALLTAAWVWYARRSHAAQVLVIDARPLIEKADVVSLKAARDKFNEALAIKHDPRAISGLAETNTLLWLVHGLPEFEAEARQYTEQAVADDIQRAERYSAESLIALSAGKPEQAIAIGTAVLEMGALVERLHWTVGLAQRATGLVHEGRENLRRAQESKATMPIYNLSLGDAYEDDADPGNATLFWEQAATANSNFVIGAARGLMAKIRSRAPALTVDTELKRLSEFNPAEVGKYGLAAIELARAEALYYRGLPAESVQAASKAIEVGGPSAMTLHARGRGELATGKKAEALASGLEAIKLAPGSVRYLYDTARWHAAAGKHAEALAILEGAPNKEKLLESHVYHVVLGDLAVEKGDFKTAEKEYDAAMALKENDPMALLGRGTIAWRQKKYDDATGWFEKAVGARQRFPEVYEALGLMWVEQGASTEANPQLQHAEKLFLASGTDAVRMKQFYARVIKTMNDNRAKSLVSEWVEREKSFAQSNG